MLIGRDVHVTMEYTRADAGGASDGQVRKFATVTLSRKVCRWLVVLVLVLMVVCCALYFVLCNVRSSLCTMALCVCSLYVPFLVPVIG
jgi:hypothetical protein